ncbi:hypothetical protein [Ralstonia phage RSP15]|uniref:hypothetical protein n=1 Tax=Ralstonia phage RSP15 TaxID=1785960 RepID=UPI00074D3C64|nr:hypothetical protein BH754_gp002 [Ralstonia phage RSP15]BAU39960.1 hypothetical protein [Ralstonia phage RSP15]
MFPPFPTNLDYLQVYTGDYYVGKNEKNIRDRWHPYNEAILTDTFKMPGSSTNIFGAWSMDAGSFELAKDVKEPRCFAEKGKFEINFTGTSLILRAELNWGWGVGQVYIDGVKPSTISGLTTAVDTFSCDLASYPGLSDTIILSEIILADGLSSGNHKLEIYANNASDKFVSITGIKTRGYSQNDTSYSGWAAKANTNLNRRKLRITNSGNKTIGNVRITPPPEFLPASGSTYPSVINVGDMSKGASYTLDYVFEAEAFDGPKVFNLQTTALYEDPAGTVPVDVLTTLECNSPSLTYSSTGWFIEPAPDGPTAGQLRAFTDAASGGAWVEWQQTATSFDIDVIREYGVGGVSVKVNGSAFTPPTPITSADPVGGSFLKTISCTGLPAGLKTIRLTNNSTRAKWFAFQRIKFTSSKMMSEITETIPLNYQISQIPPFAPMNPGFDNKGTVTWQPLVPTVKDLTIPRDNSGVSEYRQYQRFPTFCCYYGEGRTDLQADYDVLIVEPKVVTREQVDYWHSKGIKVFGYISFGEEDSVRMDPLDISDTRPSPHVGDGLGPGGYASYYCKGGNQFGEASECGNDKQRLFGQKACAVNNPNYLTSVGRCSPACSKDSRNGEAVRQAGGTCGGGYTRDNYWIRDAMKACSNSACPKYTPLNKGCTQYQESDVHWGQDFSIATPNYPDQNGIWGSSYINPLSPKWFEKLRDFYLPYVFGDNVKINEDLSVISHVSGVNGATMMVARVANYPFDDNAGLTLTTSDGSYTYVPSLDYSYDATTGVFNFVSGAGSAAGHPISAGQTLKVQYYKKGLNCDGVFMDTIDTVDVYPSPEFQQGMADVINNLKALYPNKDFFSNRGFTIFDKVVKSCRWIMFESFISDYNFETGTYQLVSDPDSIAFNLEVIKKLHELRKTNTFDVVALNYAPNDSSGDSLRAQVNKTAYELGFMSWLSNILLSDPLPIKEAQVTDSGVIRSNVWNKVRSVKHV